MKRNLQLVRAFVLLGLLLSVNILWAQDRPVRQGDYRSTTDGSYGNPATWEQYHNTHGWRNCLTANIAPPGRLSPVTIKSGTTVFLDDGSNTPTYLAAMPFGGEGRNVEYPYAASKLVIEAGARLISTVDHTNPAGSNQITHPFHGTLSTNSYDQGGYTLRIYGDSILNNGELGGPGVDGIILEMPAPFMQGTNFNPAFGFRLTGTGTTEISKLRMVGGSFPAPFYAPGPDVVVYIEQNMLLNGQGPAFTAVHNPMVNDNYRLWIAPGVTVTLTNPLAMIHNQAVSGGMASTGGQYKYDIDGTLDVGASTLVQTFTRLASVASVITVDVTPPGKLFVQQDLTKTTVANSVGQVLFIPESGSGVIIVPLDLLTFTARLKEGSINQVLLDWSTTNEVDTKAFYIQRSEDGKNFETIGQVATNNRPGVHKYSYIDNKPFIGTSYYILKQLDIDGNFRYSPIVSVFNKNKAALVAYPNPAKDRLNLVYNELSAGGSISLVSSDGKRIKTITPAPGSTQTTIDLSGLKAGIYLIKFDDGSGPTVLKIVKN